jgi:hypothetical protein
VTRFPVLAAGQAAEAAGAGGLVLPGFWQEACAPCRALEPPPEAFTRRHRGEFTGYRAGIAAGQDTPALPGDEHPHPGLAVSRCRGGPPGRPHPRRRPRGCPRPAHRRTGLTFQRPEAAPCSSWRSHTPACGSRQSRRPCHEGPGHDDAARTGREGRGAPRGTQCVQYGGGDGRAARVAGLRRIGGAGRSGCECVHCRDRDGRDERPGHRSPRAAPAPGSAAP